MRRISKRGNILTGNIIFLILNILFMTVLILFAALKMSGAAVLEEKYSKQIAMFLDSAKPGMKIKINMEDAIAIAEKELGEDNIDNLVFIEDNVVRVKLQDGGGYSYSFFNDVDVTTYLDTNDLMGYVFVIDEKWTDEVESG